MEKTFRDVWARLAISFDDFIRTTEARHRTSVTTLASRLAAAGDVYEGYFEGWYCVSRDVVDERIADEALFETWWPADLHGPPLP